MAAMTTPRLAHACRADVGEGPVWDATRNRLLWTDITSGDLHAYDPARQNDAIVLHLDEPIGAVAPANSGELVLALRGSIVAFDEHHRTLRVLAEVEPNPALRFNDAAVDPQGRFVAGTMAYDPTPGTAGLYRREIDGSMTTLIDGVGLSNGTCWSADGNTMYYVESLSRQIRAYDYRVTPLPDPSIVMTIPPERGTPDGLTIDDDGNLWVALWGGSAVWQISPEGHHLATIPLPVTQVTSVAFGGAGSSELFITTAAYQLSADRLADEPLAGSLFVADVDATGVADCLVEL